MLVCLILMGIFASLDATSLLPTPISPLANSFLNDINVNNLLPAPLSPQGDNDYNSNIYDNDNDPSTFYCAVLGLSVRSLSQCPTQSQNFGQRFSKSPAQTQNLPRNSQGYLGRSTYDIFESKLRSGTYYSNQNSNTGYRGWGSIYNGDQPMKTPIRPTTPTSFYNSYSYYTPKPVSPNYAWNSNSWKPSYSYNYATPPSIFNTWSQPFFDLSSLLYNSGSSSQQNYYTPFYPPQSGSSSIWGFNGLGSWW